MKVLISRYGRGELVPSFLRLCGVVAVGALFYVLAAVLQLPVPLAFGFAAFLLAVAAAAGLDIVGKALVASAVVGENTGDRRRACALYGTARLFLSDTAEALRGLAVMSEGPRRLRLLRKLARSPRSRSGELARFVVSSLAEAGDVQGALRHGRSLPRDVDAGAALAVAALLLENGNPDECLERLAAVTHDPGDGRLQHLRAAALAATGKGEEALLEAQKAVEIRPFCAEYLDLEGILMSQSGRDHEATALFERALRVNPQDATAHFNKALASARLGRRRSAVRSLQSALYYDNTNTAAFLKHAALRRNGRIEDVSSKPPDAGIHLQARVNAEELRAGEKATLSLSVSSTRALQGGMLAILEPFGGGVRASRTRVYLGSLAAGETQERSVELELLRPSAVNLGKPWRVVVVCVSIDGWASSAVDLSVQDENPGRVFLVLSEDHETSIRRARMEATGGRLKLDEARRDLIDNTRRIHEISLPYGMKWTHLVDVGTGLGLVRWAAAQSAAWNGLYGDLLLHYREASDQGHDIQLHLHLSGFPCSYFFCYGRDAGSDELFFDMAKKNSYFPGRQVNSWANVVPALGAVRSIDSRLGSIAFAKGELRAARIPGSLARGPVLFRAGQWDFGSSIAEREKSALALMENGLFADSSATEGGTLLDKGFSFGRPPESACYYARGLDVGAPARSLAEAGITEVLPLLLPQGRHPVTPRDNPRVVARAYGRLIRAGRVLPGRHILMEMEHIATVGGAEGDESSPEDWSAIRRHFETLRRACPLLESKGAAEALESWWDYNAPQPIATADDPAPAFRTSDGAVHTVFPLRFLAAASVTERSRRFSVLVRLPFAAGGLGARARILRGKTQVWAGPLRGKSVVRIALLLSRAALSDHRLEIVTAPAAASGVEERKGIPAERGK
jgi:Tfp pilus assembly protein PilF